MHCVVTGYARSGTSYIIELLDYNGFPIERNHRNPIRHKEFCQPVLDEILDKDLKIIHIEREDAIKCFASQIRFSAIEPLELSDEIAERFVDTDLREVHEYFLDKGWLDKRIVEHFRHDGSLDHRSDKAIPWVIVSKFPMSFRQHHKQHIDGWKRGARQHSKRVLMVSYERLRSNMKNEMDKIFKFAGLEPKDIYKPLPIKVGTRRIGDDKVHT